MLSLMHMRLLLFTLTLLPVLSQAQARLVLNNNAFVVIDNSAFVVIDNPATNAVTTVGTGGNIVTEYEFDRVKWNIGTNTGSYVMPFTSATGIKIPFTVNINTAGAGAGNIMFSTYNGPIWDNNTYRPTDVTHMFDFLTGTVNNSDHVIDRFWIIDANGYTTKPSASLGFTYIDAEHTPVGNNIVEADLGAQRFNNSLGLWGDYLPVGAINTATNTVVGVPAIPADFFRSWTLSEVTNPLPVELISFNAFCKDGMLQVNWITASETQTLMFYVQGSDDGNHFENITSTQAAGNSVTTQTYQVEVSAGNYAYYRLVLVNANGSQEIFPAVFSPCSSAEINTWIYSNGNNPLLLTNGYFEKNSGIVVTDMAGKIVEQLHIEDENTNVVALHANAWSNGMYMLVLINGETKKEFKFVLSR